jgi:MFS transporter, FSR family, fosmidomycin resistance protein
MLTESARSLATTINGPLQAAMQAGMGIGGLLLGLLLARHHERGLLIGVPLAGAAAVACFPLGHDHRLIELLLALLGGVGFAGTLPITIAMAQRLLPHRTGLASGLMMGGAWGLAGVGPIAVQKLVPVVGMQGTFWVTASLLGLSGVLGMVAPLRELAGHAREDNAQEMGV